MLRRVLPLFAAAAVAWPGHVASQTLTGRVVEQGRGAAVSGVTVSLLDEAGERRAFSTSDSLGRFSLTPPEAGNYVVEASGIGYHPTRSPLFALVTDGVAPVEIEVQPAPVALENLEVSVEREARRLLGPMGLTPSELGKRWIDRDDIDRMMIPGLVKDLIRLQNIPGLEVLESELSQGGKLCVVLRQRGECALMLLNGVPISVVEAYHLDPRSLEAVAVLKPVEATTFYGTGATGGAVLMWTNAGRRER